MAVRPTTEGVSLAPPRDITHMVWREGMLTLTSRVCP